MYHETNFCIFWMHFVRYIHVDIATAELSLDQQIEVLC